MPGLPPGWTYSTTTVGGAASIVIPAGAANVRHVLTDVSCEIIDISGTGAFNSNNLQVLDGANIIPLSLLLTFNAAGTAEDRDSFSDGGLTIMGAPGTTMTVQLTAGAVGTEQWLIIKGYDF